MRFLVPSGGITDPRFGILAAPNMTGVPLGISEGVDWAADLGALSGPDWVKRIDWPNVQPWLWETMRPYRRTCIFVAGWDVVGDARATLQNWQYWALRLVGWPLAYVAQDGAEDLPFPSVPGFRALFVGGSTRWKLSDACRSVIQRARTEGKHIHIGRINWWRRYEHFRGMEGSDEFTCDGTRIRYERDKGLAAWAEYMDRPYTIRLPLSGSDRGS